MNIVNNLYLSKIISILGFLFFLVLINFIITRFIFEIFKKILLKKEISDQGRIETIHKLIRLIIKFILLIIFLFYLSQQLKIDINTFLASAGAVGAVLIFIFQNILKDFVAGWFFIIDDIFRQNEEIIINGTIRGRVINFTYRYLILKNDNSIIFIPFNQINTVENLSRIKK